MFEFMKNVRKHQQERGSADLITTVMMIPFVVFSLLLMVDTGMYFQSRMSAQNMARDAVRQVAMYGGTETRLTPYNVEERLEDSLDDICGQLRCQNPPAAECGVGTISNTNNIARGNYAKDVASSAGQNVYCVVKFNYSPVSSFGTAGNNPEEGDLFGGFGDLFNVPVTVLEQGQTETGFR